ncbi:MAG TPA: TraR/DksA family transcriptional regulator [Burkholderiales bacterium]|jgi:RNA polymerase-binding transcription factor DksA|nr:TraR/DksA family transcriptional regulator [Burkholderiales bacterium]
MLSEAQTTRIARVLDELESEVRDKIRASMPQLADQKYIDLVGVVYDSADEASASMQEEVDHTLLEHYLQRLKQVEAARERLADGALNACADCGDEIGFGRLRAYPFATRCIHCQTVHEQTHGGEASSRS